MKHEAQGFEKYQLLKAYKQEEETVKLIAVSKISEEQ